MTAPRSGSTGRPAPREATPGGPAAVASGPGAAHRGGPSGTVRLDAGVLRTDLPGGTVILSERMESVRSVAIGFWFRAGTAHEPPGLGGAAHLLEHMVFKGTRSRSARGIALEIEAVGGGLDAWTSHEHITFQARVPEDGLSTAVDLLADLSFRASLSPDDLERERQVVLEEIAGVEESPEDLAFELHADLLFPGHGYGAPVLGSRESVEGIEAGALAALRDRFLHPAGLVVAAAGRLEHERLVELVRERLPDVDGEAVADVVPPLEIGRGRSRVVRAGGRQVHIVAGGAGPTWTDPLREALVVASTALGGGMSSRLFQRIREQLGLAYDVSSWQSFYRGSGAVGAYLATRPENAARAAAGLEDELARLAATGLDPEEDEATRTQLKGQLLLALESPGSRMRRLAGTVLHSEPWRSLDEVADRIDAVTTDEIRAACRLFDPAGLAVLELAPA
ncbi:MAG: pitrilysin family protein [Gemmatimonadota bacterium]|nr:pitrilysin family protein [Gemmatimonadota bacterium]